jgi:hypothetical protein
LSTFVNIYILIVFAFILTNSLYTPKSAELACHCLRERGKGSGGQGIMPAYK